MFEDALALVRRGWLVVALGAFGILLVAVVVLAGVVVTVPILAGAAGASAVACPTPVSSVTAGTVTPGSTISLQTPTAIESVTATATAGVGITCINPDANRIVSWAMAAEPHLYDCPPKMLDECYDAGLPQQFIAWWQQTCAGCSQWKNGNLQCVMLVGAVFGTAGLPLYWGPNGMANGIDFWYNYGSYPGWVEIPSAFEPGTVTPAPLSVRGLPAPGDMMAWYDRYAPLGGHLAVVVQVVPPRGGQAGSITFVEANGPGALVTVTLNPDLTVDTWTGYQVAGFIRPIKPPPAT